MGEIMKAKEEYENYIIMKNRAENAFNDYIRIAEEVARMDKGHIAHNIVDPKTNLSVGVIEYQPNNDFITITDADRISNKLYLKISVLPQVVKIIEDLIDEEEQDDVDD